MKCAALSGLLLAVSAGAEVTGSLGLSGESLSRRGADPWFDGQAGVRWRGTSFEAAGGWREVRRYGLRDAEARLDAGWKAGGWRLFGAGTLGEVATFLPEVSGTLGAERLLGNGLVGSLQWRHARYRDLDAGNGLSLLEAYRGAWHGTAGIEAIHAAEGPWRWGWRLGADRFWGERSAAGIGLSRSTEFERVGTVLREARVEGAAAFVRQELPGGTLLRADLSWTDQGGLYRRVGGGLGLEFRLGR